jgi:hypothetical protein
LQIEVGVPGRAVRHVLLDADDATIRALAKSVTIPTTSIKGFVEPEDLARLPTPDWTPDPSDITERALDAYLPPLEDTPD